MCASALLVALASIAAEEHRAPVVLVDAVEDLAGDGQDFAVVMDHGQPAQRDVEPRRFRGVVAVVFEIGLVAAPTRRSQPTRPLLPRRSPLPHETCSWHQA